jgi:class 3 adenylate cyclase
MADEKKKGQGFVASTSIVAPQFVIQDDLAERFRNLTSLNLTDVNSLTLPSSISISGLSSPSLGAFQEELGDLRKRVAEQARALREEKSSAKEKEQRISALEASIGELQAKERIGFLLSRVNAVAQQQLLASEQFRDLFLKTRECIAYVMSVDIRRSTELMLKARSPEAFAEFITTLCGDLMNIVTDAYGVFDKFTGDGILAFFPDFYSGSDAAYRVVAAADRCHDVFRQHYHAYRKSFTSVLTDIGLGIGVDHGPVHLVQMAGGLTVVGAPVVYACRLSGAPPGKTLVNQPAYEKISHQAGGTCFIDETAMEVKHEGSMLAYEVRLNGRESHSAPPSWVADISPKS